MSASINWERQVEFTGKKSIEKLEKIIKKEKADSILIVCHQNSYQKSGARKVIQGIQKKYNLKIDYFHDYKINPAYKNILTGLKLFEKKNYDLIVAIGGGSAIDTAKVLNLFSVHDLDPELYIKKKEQIKNCPSRPLVAVPTTVGTGTESTPYSILYIEGKKHSVAHQYILPDYYILDPELTMSLPEYITASSGMDALCQGIESYWSIKSTPQSKKYAQKAIELVYNNIKKAVKDSDIESRNKLLLGANYSGKAITVTKTTAGHALSYIITSQCGISHGHAVALNIGDLLQFNLDNVADKEINDQRGRNYVKSILLDICKFLGQKNTAKTGEYFKQIMAEIGLENDLKQICSDLSVDEVISSINFDRLKNNPVKIDKKEIAGILF